MTLTQLQQRREQLETELYEIKDKIAEIGRQAFTEKTGLKVGDTVMYRGGQYKIYWIPSTESGYPIGHPILKDGMVFKINTWLQKLDEIKKLES
jgi:hypothetical protein